MDPLAAAAAKAAVAFVATDIDDLVLLALWFSQRSAAFRTRHIVAGQVLGIGALVLVSLAGFAAGRWVEREWLGLLGFLPIVLGVRAWLRRDEAAEEGGGRTGTLGVAAVTFANGGDNIGVYAPLFATLEAPALGVTLAVIFAMVLGWCAIGAALARQPHAAAVLARRGHQIVPVVFIGLGVWILLEAESWRVLAP